MRGIDRARTYSLVLCSGRIHANEAPGRWTNEGVLSGAAC
jgi:hypothetical protein